MAFAALEAYLQKYILCVSTPHTHTHRVYFIRWCRVSVCCVRSDEGARSSRVRLNSDLESFCAHGGLARDAPPHPSEASVCGDGMLR